MKITTRLPKSFHAASLLLAILPLLLLTTQVKAEELSLSVSLGLSPQQAERQYKPLLDYLAQATGKRIRLEVGANSLAHWEMMRREGYDMVLDSPAFTAYRTTRMDYTVIGKLPDVLSLTLVAHADEMVFDSAELIGRGVAAQPSPSLTALRLEQLYANPMRQPQFLQVDTHVEAAQAVLEGRAAGAMLPSGLVAEFPNLSPIYTTEQLPAPGFSVSSRLAPELQERVRQALLDAHNTAAGRAALRALNVQHFEVANNATFAGLEGMLEGMWGY